VKYFALPHSERCLNKLKLARNITVSA